MMRLLNRSVCVGSVLLGFSSGVLLGGTKPPPREDNTMPPAVAEKLPGQDDQSAGTPGAAASPLDGAKTHDKAGPEIGPAAKDQAGKDQSIPLSHQDVQFIQRAAEYQLGNMILGFLTLQRAENDDLKKHGSKLVDDAVKGNRELMELAEVKEVFIPLDQIKLPKEAVSDLAEKKGQEFDKAFVAALLNEGTLMQSDIQSALPNVRDPIVREYAQRILADLKAGLNTARDLSNALGAGTIPVGEPPLPDKDDKDKEGKLPGDAPTDIPSASPDGSAGDSLRPFDNPPGI